MIIEGIDYSTLWLWEQPEYELCMGCGRYSFRRHAQAVAVVGNKIERLDVAACTDCVIDQRLDVYDKIAILGLDINVETTPNENGKDN